MKNRVVTFVTLCLVALPLLAQTPVGVVSGKVTDGEGAMPGVTVTATSPASQRPQVTVTQISGDYVFRGLPPGEYLVKFELEGFQSVESKVKVSVGQTSPLDVVMSIARLTENVVVTGALETVSSTTQSAVTYDKDVIESLPLARNIATIVNLSAGVTNNAPRNAITVSGARSNENLFLVNGVVVNENLRGQISHAFVE